MGGCCEWTPSLTRRERLFHTTSPLAATPALHTPTPPAWHGQNSIQNLTIHDFQTEGQNGAVVMKSILQVAAILWVLHFYKMGLSRKYQNVSHMVIITIFLEPCFCYMCMFTYVHKSVWFGLQYKINFLLWVADMKKMWKRLDCFVLSFMIWQAASAICQVFTCEYADTGGLYSVPRSLSLAPPWVPHCFILLGLGMSASC